RRVDGRLAIGILSARGEMRLPFRADLERKANAGHGVADLATPDAIVEKAPVFVEYMEPRRWLALTDGAHGDRDAEGAVLDLGESVGLVGFGLADDVVDPPIGPAIAGLHGDAVDDRRNLGDIRLRFPSVFCASCGGEKAQGRRENRAHARHERLRLPAHETIAMP